MFLRLFFSYLAILFSFPQVLFVTLNILSVYPICGFLEQDLFHFVLQSPEHYLVFVVEIHFLYVVRFCNHYLYTVFRDSVLIACERILYSISCIQKNLLHLFHRLMESLLFLHRYDGFYCESIR